MPARAHITLGSALTLLIVMSVAAALGLPALARAQRESEWRGARASLYAIVRAEETFRNTDPLGTRRNVYWVRDVQGLARFGLIEPELAAADAEAPAPRPRFGHLYAMLDGWHDGPDFDDGTGCGTEFIVSMYPEWRGSESVRTFICGSDFGTKSAWSRRPVRRMYEGVPDRVAWGTW